MSIQSLDASLARISNGFQSIRESGQTAPVASKPEQDSSVQAAKANTPTEQQVHDAIKSTNDFVSKFNSSVQFSLDNSTGQTIVKVMDMDTKKVLKQFPSEEMLEIAKSLDKLQGLLVKQKA